ncbi:MAG: GNAT family N-acetyltransferase [Nitrococcus mobilis]|nr:GNAT family N-acetyltransferase [Nitrococcus mobilis]
MTMRAARAEAVLVPVHCSKSPEWPAFATLYQHAFPFWEREPLPRIAARIDSGRYRLTVLRFADEPVAGFHLLDRVAVLDYAVLTFLAVHQALRGRGLGRRLLRDALCGFHAEPDAAWLFVEAEAERVPFYLGQGFRQLALDYRVPHFGSLTATQPMMLLTLHRSDRVGSIAGELIRRVIEHLFSDGYQVRPDDPRLVRQLQRVPDLVGVL